MDMSGLWAIARFIISVWDFPSSTRRYLSTSIYSEFLCRFTFQGVELGRKMGMNVIQAKGEPLELMSSERPDISEEENLLSVSYTRLQKPSSSLSTTYDGIEQNVDVVLSTFIFKAVPEPVISLYDFIMNTFVPEQSGAPVSQKGPQPRESATGASPSTGSAIRVTVKLDSIRGL